MIGKKASSNHKMFSKITTRYNLGRKHTPSGKGRISMAGHQPAGVHQHQRDQGPMFAFNHH